MPNFKEMLGKAREEEAQKKKRAIVKGIRPDRILRGEVDLDRGALFNSSEIALQGEPKAPQDTAIESISTIQVSELKLKSEIQKSEQTQNKVRTKSYRSPEQSQNKPRTKSEQGLMASSESQNKVISQPRTKSEQKSEQTQNKVRTNCSFISLVGLQRRIVLFIYSLCRGKGDRNTGAVSLEQLSNACETTSGAAQVTVRRLINKKFLLRVSFKDGRGGWTVYELPESVYSELFQLETQNKVGTNLEQSQNKVISQPRTQPRTSASSSSSLKDLDLNKLTNTGEAEFSVLPAEWTQIDTTPVSEIRFGQNQLLQIFQMGKLSAEQVQESIYAFAFDLEVNERKKVINGAALNFFMGILRKGPYGPPTNYEAPGVRQMRLYLEAKKREQQARSEMETELETMEFNEWVAKLSTEERLQFVPESDFSKLGSQSHNMQLKQHFRESVWLERKERNILRGEV